MSINIAYRAQVLLAILSVLILSSCIHKKDIDKQILFINPEQHISEPTYELPPPITIWVHGTIFLKKPTYYELYHKNPTLVSIADFPIKSRYHSLARKICEADSEHFSLEEFYIFCWSGHFSIRERKIAAKKLYKSLINKTEEYEKKYHCKPVINIITHSHGGNLVLHMAKIHNQTIPFTIKSLILLACPVQQETMNFINTPLFEQIYSLYSGFDFVQILAPQIVPLVYKKGREKDRFKTLSFSSRLFPYHPHVIQAKLKVNDYPVTHTYFSHVKFASMLPQIIKKLNSWDAQDEVIGNAIRKKYKLLCIYTRKNR